MAMAPHETSVSWHDRLARLICRTRLRAFVVLVFGILIAAVGLTFGLRISINDDIQALLSRDSPAISALDELRERQGAVDYFYVAVKSTDYDANVRMVEAIAERMRSWPEVVELTTQRDYTPIRDRALYYLSLDDLTKLRDDIHEERQRAVARKLRMGVADDHDPDLEKVVVGDDWDVLPEDEEPEAATEAPAKERPDEQKSVGELLDEQRQRLVDTAKVAEEDVDVIWPEENEAGELIWEDTVGRRIASEKGDVHLVEARLTEAATNLQFAARVSEKLDRLVEELDPESYASGMMVKVGGAYTASHEVRTIVSDLKTATTLSALFVTLVLVVAFRSIRGLFVVLTPVTFSVGITLSIANAVYGELNLLTAFLFAVLLGIGVDFAVHLYAVRERQGPHADWGRVFRGHLRPLFGSMFTTLAAMATLMLADFKGFREFGLLASIGVVVSFVVAIITVPALDVAFGPLKRTRSSLPTTVPTPAAGTGWRFPVLALIPILAVAGLGAPHVAFQKDLHQLRAPETKAQKGIGYAKALGKRGSGTPVVLLAGSKQDLAEAVDRLDADRDTSLVPVGLGKVYEGEPWIRSVADLATYMPIDQEKKRAILADIRRDAEGFLAELPDLAPDDSARSYQTHLEALLDLASATPVTPEILPDWARRPFTDREGNSDRIGMLYLRVSAYDLEQVVDVTTRFRSLVQDLDVIGASTRFVLADLTLAVERDAARLPPLALLAILLFTAVDRRRLRPTLICFGTLCAGLGLTFGIMGLWPIRIDFYNLVVMPAVVGLGIDASIHLWHARKLGAIAATSKGALVSALTTAGGFGGLVFVAHKGLVSIGLLGVVATLSCVLVAVSLLAVPLLWKSLRSG